MNVVVHQKYTSTLEAVWHYCICCSSTKNNTVMELNNSDFDILDTSHSTLRHLIKMKGDMSAAIEEYLTTVNCAPLKEFPKDLQWFNIVAPLTVANDLKGKIVIMDFFTYCCINCLHIIPELRELEQEFKVEDGLLVIGVHTPKFENEKHSENILSAVQRYNIGHPVVNDCRSEIWRQCYVNCWPTLLIIDPKGCPIIMLRGEGHKEFLRQFLRTTLNYYKKLELISTTELHIQSSYRQLPCQKGPLLFPGKITSYNNMLAVSDTGNHRILIINPQGMILYTVGGGNCGFRDGTLQNAEFNSPQGLVFYNETVLYVADTENHAIRKVDLDNNRVETLVGTGRQGTDRVGGQLGTNQELSSPWDLCLYKKRVILIAMAGTHQIWGYFLEDTNLWRDILYTEGTCICLSGSGEEANRNNSYPLNAAFAQPSGLTLCTSTNDVYVADSESSAVRRLSLIDGRVTAVVGGHRNPHNLFSFGDIDGVRFEAKLQHLLGLAVVPSHQSDGTKATILIVADTYNHKLKLVDCTQNAIETILVPQDCDYFNEPAGLCFIASDPNNLYVTDTNNHVIKRVRFTDDYRTIITIEKLHLHCSTAGSTVHLKPINTTSNLEILSSSSVHINIDGGKVVLKVSIQFLDDLKCEEGGQSWLIKLPNSIWSCVPISGTQLHKDFEVVLSVPAHTQNDLDGRTYIDMIFTLMLCADNACLPQRQFIVRTSFIFTDFAPVDVTLDHCLEIGITTNKLSALT